jgi:tetratricopeptide (TPR) repeat protein
MRIRLRIGFPLLVALCTALSSPVHAQTVRTRVLDSVRVEAGAGAWEARIQFQVPVQYRRHWPEARGDVVAIQVRLLERPELESPRALHREVLDIPRDVPGAFQSITYERNAAGEPTVEVRFSRPARFEVKAGRDLRSIVVRMFAERKPLPPTARTLRSGPKGDFERLMEEGERAMTAHEYQRAALIFDEALAMPGHEDSAHARELLGLARERNGQLAHAKAEYEEYLKRHPEGEGAARVRQRLDALLTARAAPPPLAPPRSQKTPEVDFRGFGSIYVGYRRASALTGFEEEELSDSSIFSDLYADTRVRREDLTLRGQVSGGYRYDFLSNASADESRVSSLFFSAENSRVGVSGSVGRRSRSTGGVLGRYDGAELAYQGGEHWRVGVVGGAPVDSPVWDGFELDRYLAGAHLDLGTFARALDLQVFGIGQFGYGIVDRAAVGGEVRYFRDGISVATFIDYDVHFLSLNVAQLVASWQMTASTEIHTLLDYRNVPILTSQNALIGQPVGDMDDLLDLLDEDEVKELAEDRTARAANLSVGLSHRLSESLQLGFEVAAAHLSDTPSSGGVEGIEGTGFDFSYFAQIVTNGMLVPGDIGLVGLRYFDGDETDLASLTLEGRYPLTRALRFNPSAVASYRFERGDADGVSLIPSIRFDWRLWRFVLDAEGGLEWRVPLGDQGDRELGYFTTVGVRCDF